MHEYVLCLLLFSLILFSIRFHVPASGLLQQTLTAQGERIRTVSLQEQVLALVQQVLIPVL